MNNLTKTILGLLIAVTIIIITEPLWHGIIWRPATGPVTEKISADGKSLDVDYNHKTYKIAPRNNPVDRVHSRETTGVFEIMGKGENAKWAVLATADFTYFLTISTESRILKKETTESGRIKIEENRTFNLVRDDIIANNADVKLNLNEDAINLLGTVLRTIGTLIASEEPGTGFTTIMVGEYLTEKLKEINGQSLKDFFKKLGVPESILEPFAEMLAEESAKRVLGLSGIRSITGKEFKIVWYQDKHGVPLHTTITKLDGEPLTEDERILLSRLNILLDYDVVPQKEFKTGDTWTINATDIEEVFDPFVKGHFTGEVNVTVKDKNDNGYWSLEMAPCTLKMTSDAGKTIGNISVNKGEALIAPENITVDKVYAEGEADVSHVSHRHFLYETSVKGSCSYKGVLRTTPIEDAQPEGAPAAKSENAADTNEN